MIVRLWHGRVPAGKAEAYRAFLNRRALADYRAVPGNLSAYVMERTDGEITHFVTMTFWTDYAAIQGFAGDQIQVARYYAEDRDYLLEYEPEVVHYEVVGQA